MSQKQNIKSIPVSDQSKNKSASGLDDFNNLNKIREILFSNEVGVIENTIELLKNNFNREFHRLRENHSNDKELIKKENKENVILLCKKIELEKKSVEEESKREFTRLEGRIVKLEKQIKKLEANTLEKKQLSEFFMNSSKVFDSHLDDPKRK